MDETKEWLKQAEKDLETAKYNLNGGEIEAGVFFFQQSVEKALKALYIKKHKKLLKVHDLNILAKKVDAPINILNYCKKLNPAYQYTRYPDVTKVDSIGILAKEFLIYAEEILKWVKKKI